MDRKKLEKITENVIYRLINEGFFDKEEYFNRYEEYCNDYPNDNFKPEEITKGDLLNYIQNTGDFLYIFNSFRGWRISGANSSEVIKEIYKDVENCAYIEPTHEFDYLLAKRQDLFKDGYVTVLKIKGIEEEYAIIYII